ncbi:MAG: DUF981 family protein [Ferroplasma sp.]
MFIDDLPLELFLMSLIMVIAVYMNIDAYLNYKKNGIQDIKESLKPGAYSLGIFGALVIIFALYGEMLWPLPGSYNILFYDPFTLFGIIVIAVAVSIILKQKLQYIGILALFSGLISIFYGAYLYKDGFTSSPIAGLGLYIAFGLTGVFAFPVTLAYDTLSVNKKPSDFWKIIFLIFWIGLIMSAFIAAFIALEAVPAHLLAPP